MSDSIGMYLNEIGKVALLTAEEERSLSHVIEEGRAAVARIAAGEHDLALTRAVSAAAAAKDRFIRANLRLVVSIARRYPRPQGIDLGDLIQEGNLGLEHAVDKFDSRRGFKFSTYATFWIRQAIGRALDHNGSLIRIPGNHAAQLRSMLRHVGGDAGLLDAASAELHRLTSPVSLDKPVGDDGDGSFGDLIATGETSPEDIVIAGLDGGLLGELLAILEPRSRYAVASRFGLIDGDKHTYREIGEHLGVTAEAARRLTSRALDHLRGDADRVLVA